MIKWFMHNFLIQILIFHSRNENSSSLTEKKIQIFENNYAKKPTSKPMKSIINLASMKILSMFIFWYKLFPKLVSNEIFKMEMVEFKI